MDLQPAEIRVLGCLLEKQRSTPDAYPLSLNALRLACNQATNRDPVVDFDAATVRDALHRLGRRRWTRLASGAGSRAPKYRHLLDDALPMGRDESAVLCVLMLRGPQTPGELKQRAGRMHPFADLAAIGATLERLTDRGLAARLERRPGQKEERYRELLGEDAGRPDGVATSRPGHAPAGEPAGEPPLAAPAPLPETAPHVDRAGVFADGGDSADENPAGPDRSGGDRSGGDRSGGDLEARVARLERALAALGEKRLARLERDVAELREALGG